LVTPSRPVAVALSPAGDRALVGCAGGELVFFAVPSGARLSSLEKHAAPIAHVAFGADSVHSASAAEDGTIAVHDAIGFRVLDTISTPAARIAFSPDGSKLLVQAQRMVRVLDAKLGTMLRKHETEAKIGGAGFTAKGDVFVAQGWELKFFDAADAPPLPLPVIPKVVATSRDGRAALVGCISSLRPWDLDDRKEVVTPPGHRSHVTTIAAVASSSRILTAGYDGRIVVWELATGEVTAVLGQRHGIIYAVTVAPDGEHVLSTGSDKKVKVWDARKGSEKPLREYTSHTHVVHAVAASPRNAVASAGLGAKIHLWDLERGEKGRILSAASGAKGREEDVNFLAFLDETRLVSACTDGRLILWNLEATGHQVIADLGEPLTALDVSREKNLLVVGTKSGRLLAIPAVKGAPRRLLDARQKEEVFSIAISADATKVVSGGGNDTRVFLSDLESGAVLDTVDLKSSRDTVHSVAWAPDGRSFLLGTLRGVVLRFEVY
ncbi:MAG: hypothetical protein ACAI25_00280, partial [Planctomycetota bacterium]